MDIICCNAKIKRPCSHLCCAPDIHICFYLEVLDLKLLSHVSSFFQSVYNGLPKVSTDILLSDQAGVGVILRKIF